MARKRSRKLRIAIVVLIVLVALIGFAPMILSLGPARSIALGAIGDRVDGTVEIDAVRLRWFGEQEVQGFHIVDRDGRDAVSVDLTLGGGLLNLLRANELDVHVNGSLHGALREDGSTSFQSLLVEDPDKDRSDRAKKKDKPGTSDPLPALSFEGDLAIDLDVERDGTVERMRFDRLVTSGVVAPGGSSVVKLKSPVQTGDVKGDVDVNVVANGLISAQGKLTPRGAEIDGTVTINGVPVPYADQVLDTLTVKLDSADLTDALTIAVDALAKVKGGGESTLRGELRVAAPMSPDGAVQVSLGNVNGELAGRGVPTAFFQPLLRMAASDTPIVLRRDLGPTIDVDATFGAQAEGSSAGHLVKVDVSSDNVTMAANATLDARGSVQRGDAKIQAKVQPELLAAYEIITDAPAAVRLDVERLSLPAVSGGDLSGVGLVASLAVDEPVTLRRDDVTTTLAELALHLVADPLSDGLRVTGGGRVDEGRVTIDERITSLLDETGALALAGAQAEGEITVENVDSARLAGALIADLDPRVKTLAEGPLRGTITNRTSDGMMDVTVDAKAKHVQLISQARKTGDRIDVAASQILLRATPALAAALQSETETPIRLTRDAQAIMQIDAFTVGLGENAPAGDPVRATLSVEGLTVEHDSLASPLAVKSLLAKLAAGRGEDAAYEVEGNATLASARATGEVPIGEIRYDVEATAGTSGLVPRGSITIAAENLGELESLLDIEADSVSGIVGDTGSLVIDFAGGDGSQTATVTSDLPFLRGKLSATLDDEMISLRSDELQLIVQSRLIEDFLAASDETEERKLFVTSDVPMRLRIAALEAPLALFRGEPFTPGTGRLDIELSGGPVPVADETGPMATLRGVVVNASTSNIAEGIVFDLAGKVDARDAEAPGTIVVKGSVVNVLDDESRLALENGHLNLDATVERVPTALADLFSDNGGMLEAALGPEMSATAKATDFSRNSGRVVLDAQSQYGSLKTHALGRKDSLVIPGDTRPLEASLKLSPDLREHLLRDVHPIFADVRTMKKRMRLKIPTRSTFPLDGDVKRMKADVEIIVGDVELDAGSGLLGILAAFGDGGRGGVIPGKIDPIRASIRKGIVTYEPFGIHVDKFTIHYQGTVNLNTRMADLRTEIPLAALGDTFKEVKGYVDNISIPFVARGSIDEELKSEIDPDFDLGAALAAAGVQGAIGNILGDKLGGEGAPVLGPGGLLGGAADEDANEEDDAEAKKKERRKKRRQKKKAEEEDGGDSGSRETPG